MSTPITGISSMATRQVLAELVDAYTRRSGAVVAMEAVGGVDAARRVQAGEAFDLVLLASDAIDRLIASGHVVAGSRVDLVRSPVAIAVRAGAPRPDVASEAALRQAVLDVARAGGRIGVSTGPSGVYLTQLFERWGLVRELEGRTLLAPPGVPVGSLLARGDCDLAFQQLSELMNLDGVEVIGTLPPGIEFITTFSAGLCSASARADAVRAWLQFANSPEAAEVKRRHGMQPA
jgi:molybdate transport system substrate-binding protein